MVNLVGNPYFVLYHFVKLIWKPLLRMQVLLVYSYLCIDSATFLHRKKFCTFFMKLSVMLDFGKTLLLSFFIISAGIVIICITSRGILMIFMSFYKHDIFEIGSKQHNQITLTFRSY